MLTEQFFASTLRPATAPSTSHLPAREKDAGIYLQDLHPHPALRLTYKKSSTAPNGLAISSTHVFAAQADKAVVHVYDRETGKQECLVPFPEKVTCLAFIGERGQRQGQGSNGILAMGMESGGLSLWEVSWSLLWFCWTTCSILKDYHAALNRAVEFANGSCYRRGHCKTVGLHCTSGLVRGRLTDLPA